MDHCTIVATNDNMFGKPSFVLKDLFLKLGKQKRGGGNLILKLILYEYTQWAISWIDRVTNGDIVIRVEKRKDNFFYTSGREITNAQLI